MLFSSTLLAVSGLAVTLGSAATIRPRQDDASGFEITYAYSAKPSERPGSSQYCSVTFNVTDPLTQTSTRCSSQHGPCVGNSVDPPKPSIPLDRDHPAACADPAFAFYLGGFEGIGNYSLAITHEGEGEGDGGQKRLGVTGPIAEETYPGHWHYNCGGSGFCNSYVSGTVIRAPFVAL